MLKFLACCLLPDKNFTVIAFSDASMYATSMTQRNVLKATVADRMVWLPTPACVIAAERLSKALKTHTQMRQAICTSVLPSSKTPVNQKVYHLNTLHLYQRKLENEQRKNYRILISSCWHTDIRFFDFYSKRGLGRACKMWLIGLAKYSKRGLAKCGGTAGCETAEVTFYVSDSQSYL